MSEIVRRPAAGQTCDAYVYTYTDAGRMESMTFCCKKAFKYVEGSWGGMTLCREHFSDFYPHFRVPQEASSGRSSGP